MSKGVSEALLKGRRGIEIDKSKSSIADIIRNEAGLQGISLTTIAMLAGIEVGRLNGILQGIRGITEKEVRNIEEVLNIEIDRSKLEPMKYLMK